MVYHLREVIDISNPKDVWDRTEKLCQKVIPEGSKVEKKLLGCQDDSVG